jgi:hypothetical protein
MEQTIYQIAIANTAKYLESDQSVLLFGPSIAATVLSKALKVPAEKVLKDLVTYKEQED